jgi:hypothetical protein
MNAALGDLFLIPLNAQFAGAGVVAGKWNAELYLVIFEEQFEISSTPAEIDTNRLTPLFASSSLDAKIWHGHWRVISRGLDTKRFIQPTYRIEEPSGWVIESFDRKVRRSVKASEAEIFPYRKTVAPIRLENALKAHFGLTPWEPIFDDLKYMNILENHRNAGSLRGQGLFSRFKALIWG